MALNVGPVEHLLSVDIPLASDDDEEILEDIADEAARRTFFLGNGEFSKFPNCPMEIQDMIWKATIEPRTVRAIGYFEDSEVDWIGFWDDQPPLKHWIVHECNPLHVKYLPIYSVCRRSRAVALAIFGQPLGNNTTLFHSHLDTVELVGWCSTNFPDGEMRPTVSRYASEQGGVETVKLPLEIMEVMTPAQHWNAENGTVYFNEQAGKDFRRTRKPSRQWALSGLPFVRARNVVLCHDLSFPAELCVASYWAAAMVPNVEVLTIRTYSQNAIYDNGYEQKIFQDSLCDSLHTLMLKHREGYWPKLKTVQFTRQVVSWANPF